MELAGIAVLAGILTVAATCFAGAVQLRPIPTAEWAVRIPPTSESQPCVALDQAREPIAIWLAILATRPPVGELTAGLGGLETGRGFRGVEVRNTMVATWNYPGAAVGTTPSGPQLTAVGYLLAKAMTGLPERKVSQVLTSAWATWLNERTTDAGRLAPLLTRHSSERRVVTSFAVPRYLAETARHDDGVRDWIRGLPAIVADLTDRWSLRVGEPFEPGGQCSWTAPATDPAGTGLVLKVGFRFPGGDERDEAAGLRIWDGNGAVRLYAAHEGESAYALLTERCVPGTALGQALPGPEQDQVVAMLRRLWAQPHAAYPFRPLAQMCARWAEEFEQEYAAAGPAGRLDPGLARAGIALFRALPQTAGSQVLLCTDLHGENVLAARRAPWLVIDPKPHVGDPAYDLLQHMLNCEDRLSADPAGLADRMAALAGIDAARVRQWLFARSVQESPGSPLMRQVARRLAPA